MPLTYQASTTPAPLQVGRTGRLELSVANPDNLYCAKIELAVPVGEDLDCMSVDSPRISLNTDRWTQSSRGFKHGKDIGHPHDDTVYAAWSLQPKDERDGVLTSLVVTLDATVNNALGTFDCRIREDSGLDSGQVNTVDAPSIPVSKSAATLYLENFIAVRGLAPVTQYESAKPVRFQWESNGQWFMLYAAGASAPVWEGEATTWTLEKGVTVDTTFVLVAQMTSGESADEPNAGGLPTLLYGAITITVSNPHLVPSSVRATGEVTAGKSLSTTGNMTAGGEVGAASASITGTAKAGSLITTGAVTAGTLKAASASIDGNINALWLQTTNGLTADGPLVAKGLSIRGVTSLSDNDRSTSYNLMEVVREDSSAPGIRVTNRKVDTAGASSGIEVTVGHNQAYGLKTNGLIQHRGSYTAVETSQGPIVLASPLGTERQIHLSGSGETQHGVATIDLQPAHVDLVHLAHESGYQVLITPTQRCAGVIVVAKRADAFDVETVDAADSVRFDWLLIGRQRAALGEAAAATMPDMPRDDAVPRQPISPP